MTRMERLNKFLAHAGVGSRRHCDDLILHGRVAVDGAVVRELGVKVDPDTQEICVDDQPLHGERLVYWLVNKPRGYLCTNHDPAGRPRVIDLVPQVHQRVYTVGRLDEDSEGLLLLTNDGDLANKLMHPRFGVEKAYLVQVAGKPGHEDIEQLLQGVWLSDGHVRARRVKRLKTQGESTWLQIVLSEGKNREIRRMLARLKHKVMRLRAHGHRPGAAGPSGVRQVAAAAARGVEPPPPDGRTIRKTGDASHMTPAFVQSAAAVVENVRLARKTYRIRLHCPELARLIRPGQFVMLRLPGRTDPLLGRPFALYDTAPR